MKIKIQALLMAMAISLVSVSGVFAEDAFAPVEENPIVESENNEISPLAASTDAYAPKRMMFVPDTGTGSKIRLTWDNPSAGLTDVKLYEMTASGDVLVSDTLSTTSGAKVSKIINSGITADCVKQYKIVFDYSQAGVADRTYYLGGKNTKVETRTFGPFVSFMRSSIDHNNNAESVQPLPLDIYIDTEVKDGATGGSLKIMGGLPASCAWDTYSKIMTDTLTFGNGKKYRLTYRGKWDTTTSSSRFKFNNNVNGMDKPSGATKSFDDEINGVHEWRTIDIRYNIPTGGSYSFGYVPNNLNGTIWIDNIQFYECDADGNQIPGTEMLIDEDFDDNIPTTAAVTLSQSVTSPTIGVRDMTLNFDLSAVVGADFYVKEGGDWSYRGQLASTFTTMKFENASGAYGYKIVPFGASGTRDLSQAKTLEGTVEPPAVEIGNPELTKYDDGTGTYVAKTALEGAGNYKITVPVLNNSVAAGYTYTQVIAIYDGAKLVDVISTSPATAIATTDGIVGTETTFTIDANADKVKVYLIDSNSTWEKIKDTVEFN